MDAAGGTTWMTASAGSLGGGAAIERGGLPATSVSAGGFGSVLRKASALGQTPEQRARQGAEDLVAVALVQPVLKSLRANNHASEPFAPGDYEKTFAAMADSEMASRLVKSGRWGLVDAVARNLLRNPAGGANQATAGGLGDGGNAARKPI